ncbi:ABC transporter permease [Demequina zhanjiangensis]|uniref:Autoinducer 2 import system permease protein LsrC n=1 Tax=Demequina zhanjiangensis TaxID=3051659 RepID=A0ABT8FXV2_9MICO|nr:ABC transporter permease [Demequina sp. SYSU T00b26]MDN4471733.1 ABC transporter permease [Demequina sp. SYSU T00b26]
MTLTETRERTASLGQRALALVKQREVGVLAALILVIVITTAKNPNFLFSNDGFRDLLVTPSLLMLIAVGQAMVIITRNVDLSVGSVMGLSAYLVGRVFVDFAWLPWPTVFLIGLAFGGGLGLINGLVVAYAKVPSLVVTLGTLYAYRGINVMWTGSERINASDMPREFLALGTESIGRIPVITLIALVVLGAAGWYMTTQRGGREFYAMGSDPDAATLYGLNVRRRLITAFVVSGALAGLAGVLYAARYGTVNSQVGSGYELQAVGAAVIGGVAIFGGSGTVFGAAIGAFLLMTINRALPVLGVQDFWQQAVVGVLIVGAIVLDRLAATRQERALARERERSHD